jgi:hypothetical protein
MKRALLRSANSGQGKPSVALFLYPQRTLSIRGKCAHSKICSKAPNAGYCANLWSFSIDSVYYVEPGRRTNPSTASVARKDALCSQMLASAYPDRSIGGAAISRRSAAPWPAPGC